MTHRAFGLEQAEAVFDMSRPVGPGATILLVW